jgi:hypothetical protein
MNCMLYVLSLKGGYFYVGTALSSKISYSIKRHFSGSDTEWTKINKPLAVVKQIPCITGINPRLEEDLHVKQLMIDYGMEKVRGGSYFNVVLSIEQRHFLEKELQYAKAYKTCIRSSQIFKCWIPQHKNKSPISSFTKDIYAATTTTTSTTTTKTMNSCVSIPNLIEDFYLTANALINSNYFDNRTNDCVKATLSIIEITYMKMKRNTVLQQDQHTRTCHHGGPASSLSPSSCSPSSPSPLSSKMEEENGAVKSWGVNISLDDPSLSHEQPIQMKSIENSERSVVQHQNISTIISQNVHDQEICCNMVLGASNSCTRCGRNDHHRSRCHETVDIHGFDLSDCF